jgi:hypothetical protein
VQSDSAGRQRLAHPQPHREREATGRRGSVAQAIHQQGNSPPDQPGEAAFRQSGRQRSERHADSQVDTHEPQGCPQRQRFAAVAAAPMAQLPMFIGKGSARDAPRPASSAAAAPVSLRPGGMGLRPAPTRAWADAGDAHAEQRKQSSRQATVAAVQMSGGARADGRDCENVPGFMFVCSKETEAECLGRGLLGLQEKFLASMSKIGPTTRLFLLNFRSQELFGPFSPDGKPAVAIVPEAWKDKRSGRGAYPAQIRIATGGRYWKVAHRTRDSRAPGPLNDRQTEELLTLLADSGTRGTVALGSLRENGYNYGHGSTQAAAGSSAPMPQLAPAPAPVPWVASATPSPPPISGNTPGYLFVCTSATEAECFSRQLFGLGGSRLQSMTSGIRESSTPIFLLNFKTRIVHGVFEAVGRPAMNIEADAWCGP